MPGAASAEAAAGNTPASRGIGRAAEEASATARPGKHPQGIYFEPAPDGRLCSRAKNRINQRQPGYYWRAVPAGSRASANWREIIRFGANQLAPLPGPAVACQSKLEQPLIREGGVIVFEQ